MKRKHLKRTAAAMTIAAVGAVAAAPLIASALDGEMNGRGAGYEAEFTGMASPEFAGVINFLGADSSTLGTYCIEQYKLTWETMKYVEGTWDSSNVTDISHVTAALQQGYPTVSAAALGTAAIVPSPPLTEDEAAAATQAVIWHYTDGTSLDASSAVNTPNTIAAYNYLLAATAAGASSGFTPALSVSPSSATGAEGSIVGPFTITTNLSSVTVSVAAGAEIVDAGGDPITPSHDGDVFYVKPSGAGTYAISLSGTKAVGTGRVFLPLDENGNVTSVYQKLVTISTSTVEASASASVEATTTTTTTTTTTIPSCRTSRCAYGRWRRCWARRG